MLALQLDALREHAADLQRRLSAESEARNEASSQAQTLQHELTALRTEAARQLDVVRQEQDRQASEFQQAIAARDAAFRAELDTATQRLESVQASMLQQIDDARQGHRRAEQQVTKAQQHLDQVQSQLTELRLQFGLQSRELKERSTALDALTVEKTALAAAREALITELATMRGRLESAEAILRAAESRASVAENRFATFAADREERKPRKRYEQEVGAPEADLLKDQTG